MSDDVIPAAPEQGEALEEVTVEMVNIEYNPNEFVIPANIKAPVRLLDPGETVQNI